MTAAAAIPPATARPLLAVHGLGKRYGGVAAVDELDLEVRDQEVLGVIGPNGAGKSTLVGLLSGALRPTAGRIELGGADVTALSAPQRARHGIGRTHQVPRPFADLTVLENLLLARTHSAGRVRLDTARHECREILERTGLADAAAEPARKLGLLRRKRLELARALALRPRILLLDEVAAGLTEPEVAELIDLVRALRGEVEAMLVIEHVIEVISACCDRVAVIDFGRLLVSGSPAEVLSDPQVAAVYLGTSATAATTPMTGEAAADAAPDAAPAPRAAVAVAAAARPTPSPAPAPVAADGGALEVAEITAGYGELIAIREVSLRVGAGEVVALLGTNGAGKTTTARTITGMVRTRAGRIAFDGQRIDRLASHQIHELGIAHCMEGRRIFAELSVEENLQLAVRRVGAGERRARLDEVYALFAVLAEKRALSGASLSGGQQQMLAIGRALMSRPRLVIFDEISLGLAPVVVDQLYETLVAIRDRGVSMVLVEQNINRALALADRAYVLERGRVARQGTAAEIHADRDLTALYLGDPVHHDAGTAGEDGAGL